jgi:PAS domain S-box-containing protein
MPNREKRVAKPETLALEEQQPVAAAEATLETEPGFPSVGIGVPQAGQAPSTDSAQVLRRRAEQMALEKAAQMPESLEALSPEAARCLLHELRVHQIELEMQNEELRNAQAELEASRARYFGLYELAPVGHITLSEQGLILDANLTAASLFGVARSALARQRLTRFILPEDQGIYFLHHKPLFETGAPQVCELRMLRPDGGQFWARLEATAAQDADGARVCRSMLSDITERMQSQAQRERLLAQIQEQARRVQGIIDTLPQGVLLLDADQRVLLANPVAEQYLDVLAGRDAIATQQSLSHLGGRPLAELLAPPPHGLWHELQAGSRTFEVIARRVANGPGPECWVLMLNDTSAARQARNQITKQERLAAVGQLAAGIAHDLNNVLATTLLSAQMLQKTPDLCDRDRSLLDMICKRSRQGGKLIAQILDFARRSPLERAPLDLLAVVKELIDLLKRTLPETVRLELAHDCDEYIVNGDRSLLQQALMNLALNAVDAMPAGGRLQFALSGMVVGPGAPPVAGAGAGDWVCLAVCDSGEGITAEHLPHLFEPFFTTKAPGQGTGLGLSQVHGIVAQHGGYVDVRSRPGEGATFTLYLPLLSVPAREAEPAPQAVPGGTETILLVEDEPVLRQTVLEVLERWGYRVWATANGREALALLAKQRQAIDLVLSDVVMPKMGGQKLYRAILQKWPAIKVLLMSGYALPENGQAGSPGRQAHSIAKPFDMATLASKIREALETGVRRPPPTDGGIEEGR